MSAHLQRLAELVLSEHLGETVTSVGLVLIRTGKRALRDVIKEAKLRKDEVQKCLLVLMQHGLVRYEAGSVGLYEFNLTRLLAMLHYPKYIAAVKPLHGDVGELVVEDLLCNGSSLLSSVVQRVAEKLEGRSTTQKEPQELSEVVKVAFHALVQGCYVMRHSGWSSSAGGESSDKATSPSHPPAATHFAPLPEALLQSIVYRKRSRSDVDGSALPEGGVEGDEEPTAKRVKRTEAPAKEAGDEPIDAGVQWTVNLVRFLYQMKHNRAVAAITKRIDAVAGNVLNSFLKLAVAKDPLCTGKGTSKPVFAADLLRDMEASRVHLTSEQLDQYLKILCDEKFLQHQGDSGGGVYVANFKHIDRTLCQSAIESIVRERFGPKSHRIFRLILLKKYLDQKQVADMAMLPQKEAKEMLYTLVAEHMVSIQEVPRSLDYAPARTFYLFSVNLQQVARVLLNRCYKAVANLIVKRRAEREEHRRLLEQQQVYQRRRLALEQQGASEEEREELEETLTPEERRTIDKVQQTLARLEQAELKVADTILLLTAFLES